MHSLMIVFVIMMIRDNISLDDGSEFEEFSATNTLYNCASGKDTLWQDDWEDISGHDLAAELQDQHELGRQT